MTDEIKKSEQPDPDEVLAAIQSFNDPGIITNMFKELGWSFSIEIRETLMMARQNANMSVKMKAIKHLRELLREASEAAGYVANVSRTYKDPEGGQTTFSAKRIAGVLNPTKKIESTEIKESQNDKKRLQPVESSSGCDEEEPNRGSDRGQSQSSEGTDTLSQFPPEGCAERTDSPRDVGSVGSGGTEPPDGGTPQRRPVSGGDDGNSNNNGKCGNSKSSTGEILPVEDGENPCIKIRPPTGDRDLFPGISSAGD